MSAAYNKAGAGLGNQCQLQRDLEPDDWGFAAWILGSYVNFLRTRFFGATVQMPFVWADERCEAQVTYMEVEEPAVTVIDVAGVGRSS